MDCFFDDTQNAAVFLFVTSFTGHVCFEARFINPDKSTVMIDQQVIDDQLEHLPSHDGIWFVCAVILNGFF